jgi:hypothetical protein
MSLSHSPKVVTDGLVFYYDMGNTKKSWLGKPTTNLINTLLSSYTNENGCIVETRTETLNGNPIYRVTFPAGTLPRIYTTFAYTAQQYIGSIYYRVITQGSHYPALYFRESGFGTSYTSFTFTSTTWALATINYTFAAAGTSMFLLYQSNSAATTPTIIEFSMPQAETGTFATPFVNGTRSNTQAIKDLTNNRTVTANSLTYNSDLSFTFNGTNDYSTLSSSITCYNTDYTLEAWIKRNTSNSAHGIIGDLQFGWFMFYVNSSNKLVNQHKHYNPVSDTVNSVTGTTNITPGVWYHVAVTFSKTVGMKLYVNGVLDASNTDLNAFGLTETTRGPLYLGRADSFTAGTTPNYFNGSISGFRGYSGKALSALEVQRNFNALRGRFGL